MKAIRPTKARAPTAKASHRIGVVEFLPLEGLNFAPSCWYRAWHESEICHDFTSRERFGKAVSRNRKALESRDAAKRLFTPDNYLFSTKTKGRQETLYFEDRAAKQTGRLRQQHWKGPLAKIDGKPRIHAFLSKKRYKRLKHCRTPALDPRELCPAEGRRHIEFACTKGKCRPRTGQREP